MMQSKDHVKVPIKRVSVWAWTAVLILALAGPGLAGLRPDRVVAAPPGSGPGESLRWHTDGWLDDVPVGEQTNALHRLKDWLNAWSAQTEQRPPVDPAAQAQKTAAWTVMIFIAADNNLEESSLYDINEMEAVGSSPDVNIVVEIDRSAEYTDIEGDWTEGRRYFIQQDQDIETISSPVVEHLGEIDSGDAETVADFAIWGITTYPAQKYMLVMWDHGGAWISNSSDEDSGSDITLPELSTALDRVIAQTGIDKFDVLGFDMCLMGQIEVFETIAPYARYGIGAEESEPGPGWFYVFLDELIKKPGMDGAELSGHVVDYFMQFYDEIWQYADLYGLSAVDLSRVGDMSGAVDGFSGVVGANPQAALSPVADARNNTLAYGGNDDPRYYDVWSSVDLYRFAELLTNISTAPQTQQAAQGLMQAVDQFVIHEGHNAGLDGSHGVAIYFPRTFKAYKTAAFNERYPVETPASMTGWVDFLNTFFGIAADTVTNAPTVDVLSVFPDTASIYQPAVVTLDISGRDILQVNYAVTRIINENERVVLDFDYLVSRTTTATGADIVNWSDGVTTRTFEWEGEVPRLSDGSASTYALLIPNRDNPDMAVVNGQYTPSYGGDPVEAQLIFDLNTRASTALWGINETASGALQPYEIQYQPGDTFRPLWLTLDANNDLASTSFGDTLTLGDDSITFEKVPAPSGTYSISFVAENVTGAKTLDEAIFTVDNEGLDPALRGYTDLTYGVNFRYPADWIRPRFTPDGKRLFTADLATNTFMSLYPYTDVTSAEETAAAVKDSWSNLQDLTVLDEQQVTINGLPATKAEYTYSYNGQARVGAVIAIYVPDQQVGYGFDLDAPASNPAPAQAALAALVDSINFFLSQQAVAESPWQTVTLADGTVSFQVPGDWVQEASGNWTLFGPADNQSVFVGFVSAPESGQPKEALGQNWVDQLQTSVTNLQILASQPYYVGNQEWYLAVFTYDSTVKMGGAFFTTTALGHDYTLWLEAPDADFDQLYTDVFSVALGGLTFETP